APGAVQCLWRGEWARGRRTWRPDAGTALLAGLWGVAALWVAARSMQTPLDFDSGLYHFAAIRWVNVLRIMPGLGNLHGRLAFNSSYFCYVGALNFYPYLGHGRSIANSYLFLVVLAQVLARLRPALSDPRALAENRGLARGPDLLVLPLLAYVGVTSLGLASPSADLASLLLQVEIFLILAHGAADWDTGSAPRSAWIFTLGFLAATAVTVKLSNLGFALGVAAVCAAAARSGRTARGARGLREGSLLCLLVLGIWCVRGYILSGYPAYPSTVGALGFDWSVSPTQARHDADAIVSWAREPWSDPAQVLGNWHWLDSWFWRARRNTVGFVHPLAFFLAASLAAVSIRWRRPRGVVPRGVGPWVYLAPVAAGLAFWAVTAPDIRFANALIWLLAAGAALALMGAAAQRWQQGVGVLVLLVALACNGEFIAWGTGHLSSLRDISLSGWQPILPSSYVARRTASGMVVLYYTGAPDGLIWDGPIPATPDFNPALAFRDPQRPGAGFRVK
ncbi:MAG TPA: hypothetical protein VIJ19_00675, partial [Opitutaceae bacterium]